MRWIALVVLLLLPAAGAHDPADVDGARLEPGSYLNHLRPWDVALEAGQNTSQILAFEGTPMPEGWLLVVQGVVEDGTVQVSVRDNGTLAAWTWGEGRNTETVRLAHTGFPELRVRNVGEGNGSATLSYDQTCDCIGKATALERGPLLFNIDADAGQRVAFRFNMVPVKATLSTPNGDFNGTLDAEVRQVVADATGRELTVLEVWNRTFRSADGTDCEDAGRFNPCMDVSFEAPHDGRQVLFMEVGHAMPRWVTHVRPLIEVDGDDLSVPGPAALVPVALGVAAVLRRRR